MDFENNDLVSFCEMIAYTQNCFERNNSELKTRYLIKNIKLIDKIMQEVSGYCGSFGTGYPFYAFNNGKLPVIGEQIRYNDELIEHAKKSNFKEWSCSRCLLENGSKMPDLKCICKPCLDMDNELKPRKVINRLPDIDMWMICDDDLVDFAKEKLVSIFDSNNMRTSDVDPSRTITDLMHIVNDLENGVMPTLMLPLDIHIISYSKFKNLILEVSNVLDSDNCYLSIHPLSLRKVWQYDDVPYNFVLDFLFSLTPINWNDELFQLLGEVRKEIAYKYSDNELYEILLGVAPTSVLNRINSSNLEEVYKKKVKSWKKIVNRNGDL